MKVLVAKEIMKANDNLAESNKEKLDRAKVFAINILGSPGAGKTTLLENIAPILKEKVKMAVIEGDLATSEDAERIAAVGIPALQINTDGGCHLDANMIASALNDIDLDEIDILFIENVGNLVCTAGHQLGERLRLVVLSAAEGDDKVAKYPPMFQKTNAMLINKSDLLPYTNFSVDRAFADAKKLNPDIIQMKASATTGEGINEVANWMLDLYQKWKANNH